MDNIKYDTLVKFAAYSIIVFVLTLILYLMYINFLSETFFNVKKFNLKEKFSDSDIEEKLKYINLIEEKSNAKSKKNIDISTNIEQLSNVEHLSNVLPDPNIPYILKRDILNSDKKLTITDAKCSINDKLLKNSCMMNSYNFYLPSSSNNTFIIKVIPDGILSTTSSQYTYNVNIDIITSSGSNSKTPISIGRQTQFYFPSKDSIELSDTNSRTFNISSKVEIAIIKYFNNYTRYKNIINKTKNALLDGSPKNDNPLISTYFSYLSNLLLLKNSSANTIFKYNSGYTFDINDIKTNIIFLYNEIVNDTENTINVNLKIDDQTKINFMYDTPDNINVYSMELVPSITIIFSKFTLIFDPNMPANINKSSIWSLKYLISLQPNDNETDYVFIYNDTLYFPIAIPLATPNTSEWEYNNINGVLYYFKSLFAQSKLDANSLVIKDLSNPKSIIKLDGLSFAAQSLKNFINQLGNTYVANITDIFVLYDSPSQLLQSWIVTNIPDDTTKEFIISPLVAFDTTYNPYICDTGYYYNSKCLPQCPDGFYDFGLVCLNNKMSNYLPESDMCKSNTITKIAPSTTEEILLGIKLGCDPNYFTYTKTFSQSDIISNLRNTNETESFGNVNLYDKMKNNNNIHLSF